MKVGFLKPNQWRNTKKVVIVDKFGDIAEGEKTEERDNTYQETKDCWEFISLTTTASIKVQEIF
jgi:hypothetical protein